MSASSQAPDPEPPSFDDEPDCDETDCVTSNMMQILITLFKLRENIARANKGEVESDEITLKQLFENSYV